MQETSGQETPKQLVRYGAYSPYSDLGRELDAHGVRIRADLRDEYASNPIGGVKQGDNNYGWFHFNLALNLQRIIGLKGASLHMTTIRDYGGNGLAINDTGTYTKVQEAYKNAYDIWRFGVLGYEQNLFPAAGGGSRLNINIGRLGTTTFYGRLATQCFSMSGLTCTVPQILNTSSGFTFPTSATYAANVRYQVKVPKAFPHVELQGGAFEIDKYIQDTSGFRDFGDSHATGVLVDTELKIGEYDLQKTRYPSVIKLGGYRNTLRIPYLNLNTKGTSLGLNGGTAAVCSCVRGGFYGMGEKTVWRPGESGTKRKRVTICRIRSTY